MPHSRQTVHCSRLLWAMLGLMPLALPACRITDIPLWGPVEQMPEDAHPVEEIRKRRPDYIIILPWNLKDEIVNQLDYAREWGAKFIVPIPKADILD